MFEFIVSELEKLVGELSIAMLKTKRKQEQYEVRMDSHHNSKYCTCRLNVHTYMYVIIYTSSYSIHMYTHASRQTD